MNCALITGPAGSGKTQRCLEEAAAWLSEHPGEPGVVFVVPTSAYAEEVKRRLASLQGGAAFGLRCVRLREIALEVLTSHGMGGAPLSETRAALEADDLIRGKAFELLSAVAGLPGVGESLAAFFSQARRYQVSGHDLARLGERTGSARVAELARAYEEYGRRTASMLDAAEAPARAAEIVAAGGELPFPCRLLIVDGFYDFTPVEEALLAALAGRAERTICALPLDDKRPSLFAPAARTRERLAEALRPVETSLGPRRGWAPGIAALEQGVFGAEEAPGEAEGVVLLEAASRRAEVELVAQQICRLVAEEGRAHQDIAVVFRNPRTYMEALTQVFAAYHIPFALGEETSLANTGIGRFMLKLMDWLAAAAEDAALATAVRQSSYVPEATAGQWRQRREALRAALEESTEGEQVATAIERALRDWGVLAHIVPDHSDGHLLAASDLCALTGALEAVREASQWLIEHGRWRLQELARCLPAALSAGNCRRAHWRAPGVRVVSVLEARAHAFPVVFLCDLAHGSFPVVGAEDAFLDEPARRMLAGEGRRLPPARPSLEEERLLFYLAVTRARERLYLSRPYLDEEGRPMIPSPFWEEAKRLLGPVGEGRLRLQRRGLEHLVPRPEEIASSVEARLALAATVSAEGEPEGLALLSAAPRVWLGRVVEARARGTVGAESLTTEAARAALLAGRESFSATLLERYAACPFQCFCEHFLRLGSAEGVGASLGIILHEALSDFLRKTGWRGEEDGAEEARRELLRVAEEVMAREGAFAQEDYGSRYTRARALEILGRFVEAEVSLAEERKGKAKYFEVVFPSRERGPLELDYLRIPREGGSPVLVEGRIDRVDVVEAEGKRWCVVVDYKTRDNGTLRARTVDEGYSLQLPLYLMALEQPAAAQVGRPVAAEWYCLEDGTRRRVHFADAEVGAVRGDDSRKWQALSVGREGVGEFVAEYVGRLAGGDVKVDPHPEKICDWCDFSDVCRIGEKKAAPEEREEE